MIRMEKVTIIFILWICALGSASATGAAGRMEAFSYCGYAPSGTYRFAVSIMDLQYTSSWRARDLNPPVSARTAMTTAAKALLPLVRYPKAWMMTGATLVRSDVSSHWYWSVNYERVNDRDGKPVPIAGKPFYIPIIILMDGRSVQPSKTIGACKAI